jgi:hypothetical protein
MATWTRWAPGQDRHPGPRWPAGTGVPGSRLAPDGPPPRRGGVGQAIAGGRQGLPFLRHLAGPGSSPAEAAPGRVLPALRSEPYCVK